MVRKVKTNPAGQDLRAALDVGNGEVIGASNTLREPVGFAPVLAPLSDRRAIDEISPVHSLRKDGRVFVFGVDDVFNHGRRDAIRRESSKDRYADADYFDLTDVLLLALFKDFVGQPDTVSPQLVINLPVARFNDERTVDEVTATLTGKRRIENFEGCSLKLDIAPDRLRVVPESAGALLHWAIVPDTLARRDGTSTTGATVVIDVGFETTDVSLFEGMAYQRDTAYTIQHAGMGTVVETVKTAIEDRGYAVDISRLDLAMQDLTQYKPGEAKRVTLPNGEFVVTAAYDNAIDDLAGRIVTSVRSIMGRYARRYVLAGGGAYHLSRAIADRFEGAEVHIAPRPERANVLGSLTMLALKDRK